MENITKKRFYTNKKGERIYVNKNHLETAVKIKEELQKMSPTRRTSWRKHKKMMEYEGYHNSDTNEGYRCLIKAYQKEIGRLPTAKKHVDMISDNKLASIRMEIGELNSTKLALQEQGRQVRKLTRQANKDLVFLEEIKAGLAHINFNRVYKPKARKNISGDKEMIICLSDIHYGALVDMAENRYNTKMVADLLTNYADKVIEIIHKERVDKAYVVNLGDLVEHAYMRAQNLYSAEETLSEQIINVTEIIINNFLVPVAENVKSLSYSAIAGNHDRMQGDKNSSLSTDHVVRISNKIIQVYTEKTKTNIKYVNAPDYFKKLTVKGFNFAFVHGDRDNLKRKNALAEISSLHDTQFNAVIGGHVHHFAMCEVGENKYQVNFGSVKGIDDYSMMIGAKAGRSQGVILVDKDDFEIRKINL